MNAIWLDVSSAIDPAQRALLSTVAAVADAHDVAFCVVGASARDLILTSGFSIQPSRLTADVDVALAVAGWDEFRAFKAALITTGAFAPDREIHRLVFRGTLPLGLIPYDGVEQRPGEIHWPPDGDVVMSTLGYAEACTRARSVRIASDCRVRVIDLPDLALLKLVTWSQRRRQGQPRKDAQDFGLIIRHYLQAGRMDRLYEDHAELLQDQDFDLERASCRIIGRVAGAQASPILRSAVQQVLIEGLADERDYPLARAMGDRAEECLDCALAFRLGFEERSG